MKRRTRIRSNLGKGARWGEGCGQGRRWQGRRAGRGAVRQGGPTWRGGVWRFWKLFHFRQSALTLTSREAWDSASFFRSEIFCRIKATAW